MIEEFNTSLLINHLSKGRHQQHTHILISHCATLFTSENFMNLLDALLSTLHADRQQHERSHELASSQPFHGKGNVFSGVLI